MGKSGDITGRLPLTREKRVSYRASSSRTSGREQKKGSTSCQFTNEPNREISRGVFQNCTVCEQAFPLLPSPSPFLLFFFFCSPFNFRAMTGLEALAMRASYQVVVKALSHAFYKTTEIIMFAYPPGGGGYSREFWIGVCRVGS